jgi:hypothetical protein
MFAGTTSIGGRDWVTVTVNVFVVVLPRLSVALQFTVVVPIANVAPDPGVHVTAIGPSSGSVADAVYVTTAPPGIVAGTAMSAGTVTVGAAPGSTVTVNDVLPETPSCAVAVQLTVVGPIGKVEPDAGVQVTGSVTPPPTGSVAVGNVYVTTAPLALVAFAVRLVVAEKVGGDGGTYAATVIVNVFVLVKPESVAVHVTVVVPTGYWMPDGGAVTVEPPDPTGAVHVTGGVVPSESVAVAAG